MPDRNYKKSNKILDLPIDVSFDMTLLSGKIIESTAVARRQKLSSEILDLLSRAVKIPPVKVKISDSKQYHRKSQGKTVFKQYGYYKTATNYIYIQNFTAVQGKPIAGKTFLDTLLHEWVHHYDTHKLKLDSIHTKGFYSRLRDLKVQLGVLDA